MATRDLSAPRRHQALQAARKAARFETAAAAAAHFGWSVGRYRSHESGSRNPSEEDLRQYAKSFKVTIASLLTPNSQVIEKQLQRAREMADKPRLAIAARLRAARILRGIDSAIEASKAFGVATPTYLKHENGENGISESMIELYAGMLGIRRPWLASGQLPSAFGSPIDSRIHQVLKDPGRYLAMVEPRSVPRSDEVFQIPTGRPSGILSMAEYRWSHLSECAGDISAATPSGVVQLPKPPDQPGWAEGVFSVLIDGSTRFAPPFSRIFVTRSLEVPHADDAEFLAASGTELAIVRLTTEQQRKAKGLVGRLVGKLEGPA